VKAPKWKRAVTPPNELRDLIRTIEKAAQGHPAWPVAESLLRPAFSYMEIYAANEEQAGERRILTERIAQLEKHIWRTWETQMRKSKPKAKLKGKAT
jgi:hypothetical protein